jgi:hypothetical protein
MYYNRGLPSKTIYASASAADVEKALEHIPTITDVKVTFSQKHATACQVKINVISIEFKEQFGSLPPLVPKISDEMEQSGGKVYVSADGETCFNDASDVIFKSQKGTKENDDCAGRGQCDSSSGVCSCYDSNGDSYGSSDGYGNAGTRGDCG